MVFLWYGLIKFLFLRGVRWGSGSLTSHWLCWQMFVDSHILLCLGASDLFLWIFCCWSFWRRLTLLGTISLPSGMFWRWFHGGTCYVTGGYLGCGWSLQTWCVIEDFVWLILSLTSICGCFFFNWAWFQPPIVIPLYRYPKRCWSRCHLQEPDGGKKKDAENHTF